MPQARMMTLDEKLDTAVEYSELKKAGRLAEAEQLLNQIPIAPHIAKFGKEHLGADFLLKSGMNLSEAEYEYGTDWLMR